MGILSYFATAKKDEAEKVDKLTASTLDTMRANRAGLQEAVGRLDDAMKSGLVLTMDRVMEENARITGRRRGDAQSGE